MSTTPSNLPANPNDVRTAVAAAAPPEMGLRAGPAADDEGPPFDPRRYLAAVLRYKWLLVLFGLLGVAGGFVVSQFRRPSFQASATIWIQQAQGGNRGPITTGQLLESTAWLDLVKSMVVLDGVVRELQLFLHPEPGEATATFAGLAAKDRVRPGAYRLTVDPSGAGFLLAREQREIQHGAVGDSVGPEVGFAWVPGADVLTPGRVLAFSVTTLRQEALRLVNEQMTATIPPLRANFMRIAVSHDDPVRAAAIANAVADHFVEAAARLKREKLTEQAHALREQLSIAQADLERKDTDYERLRVNTVTLPSERATVMPGGLQAQQDPAFGAYYALQLEKDGLRRDREQIERALGGPGDSLNVLGLEGVAALRNASNLSAALAALTAKQAELRTLRNRYTDQHSEVTKVAAEITTLRAVEIPTMARALVAELLTREREVDGRIGSASRQLQQIPQRAMQEARMRRDVDIAENLYTNLQQRYEEARLGEISTLPDVSILDRADAPDRAMASVVPLFLLMGLAGGLALAIALALMLDRFDKHLRYPDQVERDLGLTILGAVPRVRDGRKGVKGEDAAQVVEALRSIRLNLVNAFGTAGPLVTTITSPGSGDGKSFLASNLAIAFADAGHRTLLIDGDIRRGSLHRVLNVNRKPGLIDYLSGQATREQVVQATRIASVDFVGCGTRKSAGPELLASPAMAQLVAGLRNQYNVVIIDSAPLGAGVDPLVLGSLTGSVMLVLRTGVTDRDLARVKLEVLDRLPIRVLGAVLNDVEAGGVYRYYSYLSGYAAEDETELEAASRKVLPARR